MVEPLVLERPLEGINYRAAQISQQFATGEMPLGENLCRAFDQAEATGAPAGAGHGCPMVMASGRVPQRVWDAMRVAAALEGRAVQNVLADALMTYLSANHGWR